MKVREEMKKKDKFLCYNLDLFTQISVPLLEFFATGDFSELNLNYFKLNLALFQLFYNRITC